MSLAELLERKLHPPLRFACRGGGERAAHLRGLAFLCEAIAGEAEAGGHARGGFEELIEAARRFDRAPPEQKASRLREVLAAVDALAGLPPDLAAFVAEGGGKGTEALGGERKATPDGERSGASDEGGSGGRDRAEPVAGARRVSAEVPRGVTGRGETPGGAKAVSSAPEALKLEAQDPQAPPRRPRPRPEPARPPGQRESPAPARIVVPAYASALAQLPLTTLPGVGPRTAEALAKKGIASVAHLLFDLPRAYQDRRAVRRIRDLLPGEPVLTFGRVVETKEVFVRKTRRKIFRVVVEDGTGRLALTFFHTWPALLRRFQPGKGFFIWGEVKRFGGSRQIVHPEVEEADDLDEARLSAGRIVPVYRGMDEIGQGRIRALVECALQRHLHELPEILPEALRRERGLPSIHETLQNVHFPPAGADVEALGAGLSPWHRRLAYEELFLLSVGLALKARGVRVEPGHAFDTSPERLGRALSFLPFTPTAAQRRVIEEIARDMAAPEPMNRLLQGDVGSGKTAVALVACLLAVFDGKQAAVLAPTEILAEQHYRNFSRLLEGSGIEVALLVSTRGARTAGEARARIASGQAQIAVGTHALISAASTFHDLGLVVIDEQHRFGVEQRAELIAKGRRPDVLVMTATPIPRTLSLVLHGELTQSVIDELPPGRTPVLTKVLPARERERAYRLIEKELARGRQAYVVYPLIEESERSDLEDATRGLERLEARFSGRRLALLHGRMKADERDAIMEAFRRGEIDVLVSTTVVEVGVDVSNATVMVVENAERFGLSQLHQLRGRVGRGGEKSVCLLIDHGTAEGGRARERLATLERTNDGFVIAQADLEIRGPGEFLGTRQAGLPELQHADLARDARLLEQARSDAFHLVARDPDLAAPEHRRLEAEVMERFAERMSLARVG